MGDGGGQLESVCLLFRRKAQGVKGDIGELQFLGVVDGIYLDLPLSTRMRKIH